MLAGDPFGASDSRNNLLSAYKQIYKRAYLSGDMRVVNFIDGFFFAGGSRRVQVRLPLSRPPKVPLPSYKGF